MNIEDIKNKILEKAKSKGFKNFNIENPKTWCEKMQYLQLYDDKNKLKTFICPPEQFYLTTSKFECQELLIVF